MKETLLASELIGSLDASFLLDCKVQAVLANLHASRFDAYVLWALPVGY